MKGESEFFCKLLVPFGSTIAHWRCRLNKVLAIGGLNGFVSAEVQNSTFVLRNNNSTKNPAHRQYAARWQQADLNRTRQWETLN